MDSIQPFEQAVLVLYRDGNEVATITFEQDESGAGSPIVQLEDIPIDEELLHNLSMRWFFHRPIFRIEAGKATVRVLQER